LIGFISLFIMLSINAFVALVLSLLCLSTVSASSARSVIYNRDVVPKGWSRLHEAKGFEELEFTIVFKQETDLTDLFWSVSTPSSDNYQNYLSYDEIKDFVRLNDVDREAVMQVLREHNINEDAITLDAGDSLRIKAPVRRLASLFKTRFYHFVHATGARTIKQLGEYSVPSHIKPHVRMILGVHTFPTVQQRVEMKAARKLHASQDAVRRASQLREDAVVPVYVPQSMTALYGMPVLVPGSNKSITATVVEFVDETFSPDDLNTFAKNVNIQVAQPSHIIGNNTEAPEGIEAALDVQWLNSVNNALDPWFWLESDPNVWLYTFTQDFLSAKEVPQIFSMSYGLPEIMQCSAFSPSDCNGLSYNDYITLVDTQFQKMGLMGVSAVVCSQDRGVYALGADPSPFTPEYPGSSGYVTSVGATETSQSVYKLENPPPACSATQGWQCVSGGQEQAVSYEIAGYLSGGGFSNVDARPDYQKAAVDGYLNRSGVKLPPSSVYNATSRGCPDLAAIGTNGYIYVGSDTLVGGTSMSTPIIAAIVGLLQADYMAIANKPLGFLNPLIYEAAASNPELFTDITIGDNCQTAKCAGVQDGFQTAKGWDPVTGLGSPVVPAWRKYITAHAQKQVQKKTKRSAF